MIKFVFFFGLHLNLTKLQEKNNEKLSVNPHFDLIFLKNHIKLWKKKNKKNK